MVKNENALIIGRMSEIKNSIAEYQGSLKGVSSDLNYPSIPKQEAKVLANYIKEQLDYYEEEGYQKMNAQNSDLFI